MTKIYEIRDPIHGFVVLNDWEREIIDHPIFQRLRRIRQLSLTDMVYPSAMHTRFEHSLGVMHIATIMFDEIVKKRSDFLKSELNYDDTGIKRDRIIVRLSGLLHDIGHAPFSHVGEDLMCEDPHTKKKFKHENYSASNFNFSLKSSYHQYIINSVFANILKNETMNFFCANILFGMIFA